MSSKKPVAVNVQQEGTITADMAVEFFKKQISGAQIPVEHADPATFKTNPVTPGVGSSVISADTWGKRYASHAANAATDWEERTLTPSRDPIAAAIRANQKRIDRFQQSEKDGKWLGTMKKRTVNDFFEGVQASARNHGYENGIAGKLPKANRRFAELQPLVSALKDTIQAMPDGTDAQREERLKAARKGMLVIGNKLRGGPAA